MLLWQHAFERDLKELFGQGLKLVWTTNKRLMISFHKKNGKPILRLHESFVSANEKLKKELLHYLSHPRAKVPKSVTEFIETINKRGDLKKDGIKLIHRGENFDLRKIFRKLNKAYFNGELKGKIGWGRRVFRKKKNSITLGAYFPEYRLIKIHPVLDTEIVPPYFIESVVHHEMVHEYLHTCGREEGLDELHSPKFREIEKKFRFFEMAKSWEKTNLKKILAYEPQTSDLKRKSS